MATYNQYYRAGKRRAAQKMTSEQRRKLRYARRQIAKQDNLPHNYSPCRGCAYYFKGTCSYDGTVNPEKSKCEHRA